MLERYRIVEVHLVLVRHRANRLARWMPSLFMLALLGFIVLCTAMIVATRVHNDVLLMTGFVAGVPLAAVAPTTIGTPSAYPGPCTVGLTRSTRPTHAPAPPVTTLVDEADTAL